MLRLYRKETLLFLAAFAVRLAAFFALWWLFNLPGHAPDPGFSFPVLGGDSSDYFTLAHNLFYYHTFSSSSSFPLIPESFRLPGYPFFLYLFYWLPSPLSPMVVATVVQMLLGSGSVVLTYLLGKKFLSEKTGLIAAILLAVEPTTVFYATNLMSDTLFVFLLLFGIYLLLYKSNGELGGSGENSWLRSLSTQKLFSPLLVAFLAGAIFGYAILVRVIAEYFAGFLLLAYALIYRKELKPYKQTVLRAVVFLAGMVLVFLPWALRNHRIFNTYTLSSTPYINFTQYNLVYFYAYQHHIPTTEAQHIYSDPIPYPASSYWFRSLINEPIFKKEMADGLRGKLVPYAEFHLIKTIPFFVNDSLRDINRVVQIFPQPASQVNFTDLLLRHKYGAIILYFATPQPSLWMLIIGSSIWIVITLLGVGVTVYAVLKRTEKMWFILFAAGTITYFAILSSPVIQPRYRMPAAPFMLLLAAEAGVCLYGYIKQRRGSY